MTRESALHSLAGHTTALRNRWSDWANALIIVKPDTVVRWHRAAFKRHWARLSGSGKHPGRPRVSKEIKALIHKMATENSWGAPRIHAELLKLGFDIAEATVSRYLPKCPSDPDKVARWKAFLKNHKPEIAAMDFVTIPTATFKVLYCLFIIHHDRRRILHFNVTANPTAAWVQQQLREVFFNGPRIKYLVHDRDSKFAGVAEWLKSAGAESVRTSYRSPWQKEYASYCTSSRRFDRTLGETPPVGQLPSLGFCWWVVPGMFVQALVLVSVCVCAKQAVVAPDLDCLRGDSEHFGGLGQSQHACLTKPVISRLQAVVTPYSLDDPPIESSARPR